MTYSLFLDDVRDPPHGSYIVARSFLEAVKTVRRRGIPFHISFDHDLGPEKNGHDFAWWLVHYILDGYGALPDNFTYTIHSANPVGRDNIKGLLDNFLVHLGRLTDERK